MKGQALCGIYARIAEIMNRRKFFSIILGIVASVYVPSLPLAFEEAELTAGSIDWLWETMAREIAAQEDRIMLT